MDTKYQANKRFAKTLDRTLQAALGNISGGISPAALLIAFVDWYSHLLINPGKQFELISLFQENYWHLFSQLTGHLSGDATGEYSPVTGPQDKRFVAKSWQTFPYSYMYESFLMMQNWWHVAATDVRGVNKHHEEVVDFTLRQILDMLSPSNYPLTNPEVLEKTVAEQGQNFVRGYENFLDDLNRYQTHQPPAGAEQFVIGENIAITPGKIIYRNELIELIQYAPQTDEVYAEPILITPAWIMKYYILDLAPQHSLVNYLVKHGHTVFMISWKNPTKKERNLGLNDYLNLGILSALDIVKKTVLDEKVHLVGYCLGGTLAAIAAATLARDEVDCLASLTLLAAQTDFTEPGELGLFIDEAQLTFLENLMLEKGYLDTQQMAGAFQLLRPNDLIWSRLIHDYMLGSRSAMTDLMAWNADATRMPYRMHSEYLRNLFLDNQLAKGKYLVNDRPIALPDIRIPIFVVATERDHVSPWRSVFKINLLTTTDVTFTLTSGGHNAGIVSLPSKKTKRHYRSNTLDKNQRYLDADTWYEKSKVEEGSWWLVWEHWLTALSSKKIKPPHFGAKQKGVTPIEDAPGTYVLEK